VAFVSAGFVARMAHLMTVLGTVFLISGLTGSYALAGTVSAGYALSYSVVAPILSRLADRYHQTRILMAATVATAVSRTGFLVAVWLHGPTWSLVALSGLAGASMPAVGSFVRARWIHLLRDSPLLHSAMSFESVVDEVLLVIGPIAVSTLATAVHPAAGLILALPLAVAGSAALARQRNTQPPVTQDGRPARGTALSTPGFPVLLLTFVLVSALVSVIDLAVVAFAQQHGEKALSGWILATLAIGSAASGLWYGARSWSRPPQWRLALLLPLMTLGTLPFVAATGIGWLFVAAAALGLTMAPTLIAGYSIVSSSVRPAHLTEGLTWLTTAAGIGISAGATLAGRVVDTWGTRTAFAAATGCAVVATATALMAASRSRTSESSGTSADGAAATSRQR
jgi:MFS family permease